MLIRAAALAHYYGQGYSGHPTKSALVYIAEMAVKSRDIVCCLVSGRNSSRFVDTVN